MKTPPVEKLTLNRLAVLSGLRRETVQRRLSRAGLKVGRGTSYTVADVLRPLCEPEPPPPAPPGKVASLTEARASLAQARADAIRRQADCEAGRLVPLDVVLESADAALDMLRSCVAGMNAGELGWLVHHISADRTDGGLNEVKHQLAARVEQALRAVDHTRAAFVTALAEAAPSGYFASMLATWRDVEAKLKRAHHRLVDGVPESCRAAVAGWIGETLATVKSGLDSADKLSA